MLGFDADFCRALAAAVFGDATKVEFRPLTTQERFTALQTGEIDVLMRNTTWSLVRDSELGLNFTVVTFYDGQGIMVPADSGFDSLDDLEGGTVCVQKGTTTELNLADAMAVNGVTYTPATYDDVNATYGAYAEGRCDAVTSDKSQLSSVAKGVLPDPDAHVIMDVTLSKEPLGPVVRHGDDQWFDIVKWTIFATIAGEEYGVSSANVDDQLANAVNPEIRRLLGAEGELGAKLGLSNDFALQRDQAGGQLRGNLQPQPGRRHAHLHPARLQLHVCERRPAVFAAFPLDPNPDHWVRARKCPDPIPILTPMTANAANPAPVHTAVAGCARPAGVGADRVPGAAGTAPGVPVPQHAGGPAPAGAGARLFVPAAHGRLRHRGIPDPLQPQLHVPGGL